nr:hypothetical protein [uncultured Methanoregula sp.]
MFRTNRNAQPAAQAQTGIVKHIAVIKSPGIKNTSLNTFTTIDAGVLVSYRDVFRANHQIPAVVSFHELEVMAAAGTTVAECINFMVRLVKGEMYKTVFIGFT